MKEMGNVLKNARLLKLTQSIFEFLVNMLKKFSEFPWNYLHNFSEEEYEFVYKSHKNAILRFFKNFIKKYFEMVKKLNLEKALLDLNIEKYKKEIQRNFKFDQEEAKLLNNLVKGKKDPISSLNLKTQNELLIKRIQSVEEEIKALEQEKKDLFEDIWQDRITLIARLNN